MDICKMYLKTYSKSTTIPKCKDTKNFLIALFFDYTYMNV